VYLKEGELATTPQECSKSEGIFALPRQSEHGVGATRERVSGAEGFSGRRAGGGGFSTSDDQGRGHAGNVAGVNAVGAASGKAVSAGTVKMLRRMISCDYNNNILLDCY
jgi:hypothetical protein